MSSIITNSVQQPIIKVISSKPYSISDYFKKLRRYSFLIGVLARRELKIKYTKTVLGISWFFLQPLAVVVVYSFFFKGLIHISTGAIPYPPFVFSGLVLWYIFTGIVSKSTYALLESIDLINKVSFPRLIILFSKTIPVLLECIVLLVMLVIVLLVTKQPIGIHLLDSLFYFVQIAVFSFGLGLLCSTLVIRFRDLAHFIPFVLNFGIWLTPVFYPVSIVPEEYQQYLLYLNPLALSMEGLRGALFFNTGISTASLVTFLFSCIFLIVVFYYFVKFEKKLVENL